MKKNNKEKNKWFYVLFLCLITLLIIFLPNSSKIMLILGAYNTILSIIMLLKYKKSGNLSLLVGIMALIIISYSSSLCFNAIDNARNWQYELINMTENIINLKCFSIFITAIMMSIKNISDKDIKVISIRFNPFIIFFGSIILIYALLFTFERSFGDIYVSNTNPLYEYSLIIFLLVWMYSGDNKVIKFFLLLYAATYSLQGLLFGDRSSAFPMILTVLVLILKDKITMKRVLVFGVCGIALANFIDITRNNQFSTGWINEIINRGLNINTISYSSYAGTQIVRLSEATSYAEKSKHFVKYTFSYIVGGKNEEALDYLARKNNLINAGGGMTHSYFYFWGGYLFVLIAGILFGIIINKIYSSSSRICYYLQILIIAFAIRWLVYYPIAFFRTTLFIPLVAYTICFIADNMCRKQKNILRGIGD